MATVVTSTGIASTACPRCGGGLPGSASGVRLCTCSDITNPKTQKVCCACGADVTGKPRMKDSHAKYWCIPCGEEDRRKKGKGDTVSAGCPMCKKMVPAVTLIKHDGRFVCPGCYKKHVRGADAGEAKGKAKAPSDPERTKKLVVAGAMLAVAGGVMFFWLM